MTLPTRVISSIGFVVSAGLGYNQALLAPCDPRVRHIGVVEFHGHIPGRSEGVGFNGGVRRVMISQNHYVLGQILMLFVLS